MKHLLFVTITLCFSLTIFSQVTNVNDDFEGNGNITTWLGDNSAIDTAFSNPYPEDINPSNTVLKYEDTGGQYANVSFLTSENFDLSTNSSFSLKIYVPSNSITGTQANQMSLKLQDGTIDQPWTTQSEIIKPIVLNQWQEVSFDFATDNYINLDENSPDPTTRTDFNRVLLQVNSENNFDFVTAYIDDVLYLTTVCGEGDLDTETFTNSNLPIVIIDTENGDEIPDDPRIFGSMKIIQRPDGARNFVCDIDNDAFLDYSGTISIETRGSSSQSLPKKPYGLSTLSDDGLENDNVELLGMPSENDWILNSFAFDDSMMRDYISYTMAREMGQYAVNLKYCEVIVNGDYKGLYVLSEKIKRDGDRVDIAKLSDDENTLPEVTGGYLMQTDRLPEGENYAWYSNGAGYLHEKPDADDVTAEQTAYIESVFLNLDQTAQNADIISGYPSVIDVPSFVDYMLVAEIASNVDAYALSTYYHKDRGGKLRAGPVWDYNLTYGNDLFDTFDTYYDRSFTDVWQFNFSNVGSNFWGDLFANPTFKCYLSQRFDELTQIGEPLSYDYISDLIDSTTALISEALIREDERWDTIDDFPAEITNMKNWIQERITWMTNNLGDFSNCNSVQTPSLVITKIDYNPQETATFPESDDLEFIEIQNTGSTVVDLTGIYLVKLGVSYQFPQNATIEAGESISLAGDAATFQAKYGVAPFDTFTRSLSNKSQNLVLADAFGNVIDHVEYLDSTPWPEEADGDGFYLELINVNSDNSLGINWIATPSEVLNTADFDNSDFNFSIYPNPAEEKLIINSKQTIQKIVIFNLLGQQIKTLQVNFKSGEINISDLNTGAYIINLKFIEGTRVSAMVLKK
ncbi:CotH kinase family protein [Psychroserpens burtonensis]|uniref:CotH kinase family protein n=1 Tax=Psychroserpens burtonensis TaxID=49278 RepID=UPI0003FABF80|nr:CotH kinase family protein [Psychroserpens burtonensis]